MREIAIALIVLALIAADFGAHLWLNADEARGWGIASGAGLLYAAVTLSRGGFRD